MCEIEDKSVHLIVTSPMYPLIARWDEQFGSTDFEHQHNLKLNILEDLYQGLNYYYNQNKEILLY